MTTLLFVHGWGLDASIWDAVRAQLPQQSVAVDLGYGGARSMPALPPRVIGIGHSFGALWLLREMADRLSALVLINGFARFTATPTWPEGVAPRIMGRMQRAFAEQPKATLDAFRGRCGLPVWPGDFDAARAGADLDLLAAFDARNTWRGLGVPRCCLAAANDPIVSFAASRATAELAAAICNVSPDGGHVLPLTRPDWCAAHIAAMA